MNAENQISKNKNVLLVLSGHPEFQEDLQYLKDYFCGIVVNNMLEIKQFENHKNVYVCGDFKQFDNRDYPINIIKELSYNYQSLENEDIQAVTLGEVPVLISNAGVYFRDLFHDEDYFNKVKSEHEFQFLTESNKPSKALRRGIYLTEVSKEETEDHKEILHYRLLRCSSNLSGPTDNFRETDHNIIDRLNEAIESVFDKEIKVNHVLAQIYENKKKSDGSTKEVKAKIKAHSDKTKDMPKEGIIAFCTFYHTSSFEELVPSKTDRYDWCFKKKSGFTKLHFKLKNSVQDDTLEKEFSVTLYPNSAFLIPLSTNRLYTHEIRPSILNIDKIPVRMGYVARCSNLEALYMNEQAYIKENGEILKLSEVTRDNMKDLKNTYYEENISEKMVKYGKVYFSLNSGDYEKPIY